MEVKAQLNNYRRSPRKVRLVAKVLKGLDAQDAQNQLGVVIKGSVEDFQKLLKSALSNAENNFGLEKDNLFVKDIIVNEGAKLKRWLPRAYGRASLLLKRSSHIELILAERVEGKGRKKIKKQEIKDVKAEEIKKIEEKETEDFKEEKKEIVKAKEEKEFIDEKKKSESSKGILKRVFRRKSM
jgi:large subunit ribosomal protein L22